MKVLILRFSSIGDIVLTSPVVRCLKMQKDAEIHYCTKKQYKSVLEANPFISKLHLLDDNWSQLMKDLKSENFDLIIDLHNNLRTRRIKLSLFGKKSQTFNKLNIKKWLTVNLKLDILPNIHIVDRYMATVESIGVKNDGLGLDHFIPEKDEVEFEWLPESHRREYVAFVIGAKFNTKKLPLNRMIELCDKINKPVILIGGKEDIENAEAIEAFFKKGNPESEIEEGLAALGKKTEIFNACGKFNINQSASLLKNAKYVFTHDTGMMHIAAAFKRNIFCIWGNTIPEFGMYPYKTKFTIFENKNLACRPCSKIGFDKCPKKHFKCMNDLVFDFYLP